MAIEPEILELARKAPPMDVFRRRVLTVAQRELGADVGLFATATAEGPGSSAFGMDAVQPRLERGWLGFGAEIAPVQAEARRAGASTDRRVLGARLERTQLYREIMAPLDGGESLFVVPEFGGRKLGFLMLGRTGRRRFSDADVQRAAALAPCLSVSCVALDRPDAERCPPVAHLKGRGRELLEFLELGYTTREIALACGTSPFTVRNQLSALYRQLGVSNRAEAAGLRGRRR